MSLNQDARLLAELAVVWAGDESDPYLAVHGAALREHCLGIMTCANEDTPSIAADVRVLPSWAFASNEHYAVEYPLDSRPTLLLAHSEAGVAAMLDIARNSDEVGHADESPATLSRRLLRLSGGQRAIAVRATPRSGRADRSVESAAT